MNLAEEAWEYYECICTLELARLIAWSHGEYENAAIRRCSASLSKRVKSKRIKLILKGLRKSSYPVGALTTIRRNFDEAV